MKVIIVLTLVAVAAVRPDDFYDPKYDSFDVNDVIDNLRLLKSYAACFLGEGKCTPDGNNFKKWLPEAAASDCSKCTEKQKVLIAKVIKAFMEKLPKEWEKLHKIHDPEKKRIADLNAFLAKYAS